MGSALAAEFLHSAPSGTAPLAVTGASTQIGFVTTADEIELAILRRMSAAQKLAVMHALWRQAWALKAAGVRMQHPDWSDERVTTAVREIFRRGAA